MSSPQLRIITYNIHKGFSTRNRYHTTHHIKQALLHLKPDIICLQELQGQHPQKRFKCQPMPPDGDSQLLVDPHQWPHHVYAQNATYASGHHGNGILSHVPFAFSENINLSNHNRASRSLLHVTLMPPHVPMPLHIICVHLGLINQTRTKQIKRLCQRIHEHVPDDHPLIVAGDFNDWMQNARRPLEHELGLNEAHAIMHGKYACTFPAVKPLVRVDRIYFRGLACENTMVLRGEPWCHLSDHLPIMADFSFEC